MIGVVATVAALDAAAEAGLDLVEVSPNADPPVCKLLDYGRFKYEAQKKKNEAKKKQKVIEVKEIKMRPAIETNDYEIKMRAARARRCLATCALQKSVQENATEEQVSPCSSEANTSRLWCGRVA